MNLPFTFSFHNAFLMLVNHDTLVQYFKDKHILKGLGTRQKNQQNIFCVLHHRPNIGFTAMCSIWLMRRCCLLMALKTCIELATTMCKSAWLWSSTNNIFLGVGEIRDIKSHRSVPGWGERSSSASWITRDGSATLSLLVTRESALLATETKLNLGEDFGQGFTQIIPYPAVVTLPKLGNFTQAW